MTDNSKVRKTLLNTSSSADESVKLEQYKLYVEMADRISARRSTANSFFLTINTGIVAFSSSLGFSEHNGQYAIIGLAGATLCFMWYRLIRSYKDLNSAKFNVIHQMETELPFKLFDAEWEAVGRGNNPQKYLPFTNIEMAVPWVFLSLHIIALIQSTAWAKVATHIFNN